MAKLKTAIHGGADISKTLDGSQGLTAPKVIPAWQQARDDAIAADKERAINRLFATAIITATLTICASYIAIATTQSQPTQSQPTQSQPMQSQPTQSQPMQFIPLYTEFA